MERGKRIELSASAWKAEVLPLYEPRIVLLFTHWPRHQESNLDLFFMREPFCPLNYSEKLVGVTRFEHATAWSQTRSSTRLSYTPLLVAEAGFEPAIPGL